MTAWQFREAEWLRYNNGDMKTHHWKAAESGNFRCDEKRPGTRTNAHGSRVFTRTLTRARMPRQKSVGVEPEGELFLLTFLFIGHVTKLVVCDPRKNALLKEGNKSDKIDARKLA